ncbi:MAG TPA: carboxylating nicotinate-nucleotide diphosphorylase [Candidatus Avimonas sp.]|jgi:nicotinate-nucleotide pyrophosphorylase (carboxylating)|nr:carboxylating nicotinate-nucleotide diphosphorylase [Clostridiales bacterium]HOB36104.1 carboxylating nicotinate-nucleotide diphosphorylase [Candidatus Avimonas sp.]HQA15961.1 carboxylating nicotinate-nucleotide diphosphorylase [Candidatus Avimonas sp.]HQD37478.1 carboxylating nicotinate-nucleotide diphosphorylase [Candidatus Avimonas sp.]
MGLPGFYIDEIIKTALKEDINYIDTTTDLMISEGHTSSADIFAKAEGVLCGIEVAVRVFTLLDGGIRYSIFKKDGDRIKPGDKIAVIEGPTRALLKGERTALNLLQHMSGIATQTDRCVQIVKGTKAAITDTRKTMPGLRALQKYAVAIGGGKNHRFNLSDGAMLKDNHIDAAGGITAAVRAVRERLGHMVRLEVETRNLNEVKEAIKAGADVIMLDNMTCEQMREAVKLAAGRVLLEASGGITGENLRAVAETGVDIISIGALTHSVKALDISMKIDAR